MNPLIQCKTKILPFFIAGVLACFSLPMGLQATDLDGVLPGGNNADGFAVLTGLTTGQFNTGNGWNSLHTVTSGSFNTGIGAATLFSNTGDQNTATGAGALSLNTIGGANTANGAFALVHNIKGFANTATGNQALGQNTIGDGNTANGYYALANNTTGIVNTAIGADALFNNVSGNFNTAVGQFAGSGVTTADRIICIGAGVFGFNVSNSCFIGYIRGSQVSPDALPVLVDASDKLGTMSSSARFKKDIRPMGDASDALMALKPVTFRYKQEIDPAGRTQFGLVAEDVEKVNPGLVVRDKEGKPYTVRYDQVNAMLLNEFLKEHKNVEQQQTTIGQLQTNAAKQEATVSELKKEIEVLTAQLKEQAAQIQKVSARLEVSKPAPQIVNNDH